MEGKIRSVDCLEFKNNQNDLNNASNEDQTYTIDDVINKAGFGKFQIRLLFLSGLGWVAESCELFILSIISQFLACDWTLTKEQPAILTYAVFVGFSIGSISLGAIGDKFGRKKTIAVSVTVLFVFGFVNAFVPSFWWMVLCRGFVGFAVGGSGQCLTVFSEYCPSNVRGRSAFYLCYFWSFGSIVVALISWVVMQYQNSWRLLLGIISLPSLLVLISLKWFPESARYLLVSDQYDQAVKILQEVAKTNGSDLPPGRLVQLPVETERGRLKDLLSKDFRLATLLIWYIWFATSLATYGIVFLTPSIVQRGFLGKDEHNNLTEGNYTERNDDIIPCIEFSQQNFIDLVWISAAEFPGLLMFSFLAEKCGRKVLLSVPCIISGCLLLLLLLRTYKIVNLLVLFIARALILSIYELVCIVTIEIYPTTFRAVGLGFGSFVSKIAGIAGPYVVQILAFDHAIAAMTLLGGAIFLAGIATVFLPFETRGAKMREIAKKRSSTQ